MAAQVLWHEWFPSIWLDEHQQGTSGPRIFTMPATDPINPNVDPLIYRLNGIFGQSQAAALEAEGKTGIIFNSTYTNFWQGAMAWAGWWHNQVGLLTEVASARIATPVVQQKADPTRAAAAAPATGGRAAATGPAAAPAISNPSAAAPSSVPTTLCLPPRDITPRTEYPRPWLGGKWTLRDIVDYELIATNALLEAAADSRETLLRQIYSINRNTIEAGKKGELGQDKDKTFAILIPADAQHDPNEAIELVDKLLIGGVEVFRAKAEFKQDGKTYPAGTFVIPFNQVFARYAKDLLEKQTYPEVRRSPGAPAEAPYDVSAWSLGMQFGVKTEFAKTRARRRSRSGEGRRNAAIRARRRSTAGGAWRFPYNGALSAMVVNRLLKGGAKVSLTKPEAGGVPYAIATAQARSLEHRRSTASKCGPTASSRHSARSSPPRSTRRASASTSRTTLRWTRAGRAGCSTTTSSTTPSCTTRTSRPATAPAVSTPSSCPTSAPTSILDGTGDYKTIVAEYRGGIGRSGWHALQQFVAEGGTLVALGEASNLLVDKMPLGVKDLKRTTTRDAALRARRHREPAGGYRAPGGPGRRAGDVWASTSTRRSSS